MAELTAAPFRPGFPIFPLSPWWNKMKKKKCEYLHFGHMKEVPDDRGKSLRGKDKQNEKEEDIDIDIVSRNVSQR